MPKSRRSQPPSLPQLLCRERSPACPYPQAPCAPVALDPLDRLRAPVWVFDIDCRRVVWANQAALEVWRADSREELAARDLGADMSATVAARLAQYQADFESHDAVFNEQWTLFPEGRPVPLQMQLSGWRLPDGRMAMLCEGRLPETATPESLRSVDALLHTPMMISLYTLDGRPLYRNPAARASVRRHDEPLADRFGEAPALARLLKSLEASGEATLTMAVRTAAGERWHEVSARRRLDAVSGEPVLLLGETDVTPLKQSEAQARFLSEHDSLTQLPNRAAAQAHFRGLAERVRRAPAERPLKAAVVLIDLDRFKEVNDSWGHAAGDELLVQVAERLRGSVRHDDLVARFGGDEFLILLAAPDPRREVARIHARIRDRLARPFDLTGLQARVSATIGASVYPDDGDDFERLLQHADLAMYRGKADGRDALAFYESGMGASQQARTRLEQELRQALVRDEFELFYQPRVSAGERRYVGAEALLRWRHPERGWVLPGEFIPVCEAAGLMRELGRRAFEMAARQQAAWWAAGRRLKLSVNLSPGEFEDPWLLDEIETVLRETGCPPQALEIEITESMLVGEGDRPTRVLEGMRAQGLSIALDDFGIGYSHLAYLQRLPFNTLKIDRSFVQAPPHERPLAEAIVGLCRAMRLHAVAEGVETEAQRCWLEQIGVTEFQGWLFAPALPRDAFEALLDGRQSLPA
ncbi:putative bifunctional diguanylate cyclase/phosphodiesterase [Rubrivivax gelatinosus]|uniref:putative bifunctional diguanylate cyclase/phosphodiesterase n=1 Tax=Rubrivivax gelatinosus TaxID=28068 RepID=UPI0031F73E49